MKASAETDLRPARQRTVPHRLRPRLPRTVRGRRLALRTAVAVLALLTLPSAWVYVSTGDRVRTVESAPTAPVGIVFGAGLRPDGTPTAWLADRLDVAAALYDAGRVRVLLVSGDDSGPSYDEPGAMRAYLTAEHGIPADRVVTDGAGYSTWDSCARARTVFGVERALLVSQDFHIRRALALCDAAGIDAWGVGAGDHASLLWYFSGLREMAGAVTAARDALTTPAPRVPGPPDDAVDDALAAAG
ncbi:ElyC/SanA/YdcF family protein [Streptomyces sp. RFCAC02]|uniref:SanA/YdcF family protein n=1 Tax=Streptomyces sp. RFCAC02 TaxID=2499143 RepID=UPI001F0EC754|nr:ElyC/SanA/YdcF family protein [Streptomyces sp. RFCAC02]